MILITYIYLRKQILIIIFSNICFDVIHDVLNMREKYSLLINVFELK